MLFYAWNARAYSEYSYLYNYYDFSFCLLFTAYGYDNQVDIVFQLQHFPFDPNDQAWTEKIEVGAPCEEHFPYKWWDMP